MVETTNKLVVLCDFLENHRVKITNKINVGGLTILTGVELPRFISMFVSCRSSS
jgi:hypothetical protein